MIIIHADSGRQRGHHNLKKEETIYPLNRLVALLSLQPSVATAPKAGLDRQGYTTNN